MCVSRNPLLLLAADTIMVILRVHAEGSLPESLRSPIRHATIGALGEADPFVAASN